MRPGRINGILRYQIPHADFLGFLFTVDFLKNKKESEASFLATFFVLFFDKNIFFAV